MRVDTATLDPGERARVESLVRAVPWPELEARSPIRGSGADRFQYRIEVDAGDEHHQVITAENAVPDELKPLTDWLLERR